jgi:hypothetical protein
MSPAWAYRRSEAVVHGPRWKTSSRATTRLYYSFDDSATAQGCLNLTRPRYARVDTARIRGTTYVPGLLSSCCNRTRTARRLPPCGNEGAGFSCAIRQRTHPGGDLYVSVSNHLGPVRPSTHGTVPRTHLSLPSICVFARPYVAYPAIGRPAPLSYTFHGHAWYADPPNRFSHTKTWTWGRVLLGKSCGREGVAACKAGGARRLHRLEGVREPDRDIQLG